MPRYEVRGTDQESGRAVTVEIGWHSSGYYFGVDLGDREMKSATEIPTLPDLINQTRAYVSWDRQTYQALRDAPMAAYVAEHPGDPVTKILEAIR